MLHRAGNSRQGRTELIIPAVVDADRQTPVGGITPFTTVDMPEHMSAVFYMHGCPYRCPYCHNPQFQKRQAGSYSVAQLDAFMKKRVGFLEGVVFSGGEPLMDPESVVRIGRLAIHYGYRIGLHTTGCKPESLTEIMNHLNICWVGLDLKGSPHDLDTSTGVQGASLKGFMQSLEQLRIAGIPTEVRTTIHQQIAQDEALNRLTDTLAGLQVEHPVWQIEAVDGRPDPSLKGKISTYLESRRLTHWISVR